MRQNPQETADIPEYCLYVLFFNSEYQFCVFSKKIEYATPIP